MDYCWHYERLIERARKRTLSGYSERHHVVPQCRGGDESPRNIVRLTPEEHYVAHQLLVKMYPEDAGLLWAAVAMTNGTERMPRRNKLFGWLRRRLAHRMRGNTFGCNPSAETRAKMSASRLGKKRTPHTEETKAKMSAASKGRTKTPAHRASLSKAKTGGTVRRTELGEARRIQAVRLAGSKISAANRNRYSNDEERRATAVSMKAVWAKRRAGVLPMPKHLSTPAEGYLYG